ncbi:conserved hypothetical protein [Trichinella spiralis]|uniref:hypothetical protein n=1 Tax=Trichinella spiralis TaxID=6334 RepID=UPI0001EFBC95|nr:conserved hypothetical protein [Trichinella spiralis]
MAHSRCISQCNILLFYEAILVNMSEPNDIYSSNAYVAGQVWSTRGQIYTGTGIPNYTGRRFLKRTTHCLNQLANPLILPRYCSLQTVGMKFCLIRRKTVAVVNKIERKIGKIKFFCKLETFSENIQAKSKKCSHSTKIAIRYSSEQFLTNGKASYA